MISFFAVKMKGSYMVLNCQGRTCSLALHVHHICWPPKVFKCCFVPRASVPLCGVVSDREHSDSDVRGQHDDHFMPYHLKFLELKFFGLQPLWLHCGNHHDQEVGYSFQLQGHWSRQMSNTCSKSMHCIALFMAFQINAVV